MRIPIAPFAACLFFLVSSNVALGQPVSVGLIGGLSLTQDIHNVQSSLSDRYTFTSDPLRWLGGPMVEIRFPRHLAVETDAVYHDLQYTIPQSVQGTSDNHNHIVTWEFSVLGKYRFSTGKLKLPVKPFVDAGPTFRTAGNLNQSMPSTHGVAVGVGVEAHPWKVRIAPQFRYIRWAADQTRIVQFGAVTVRDQIQFLVGLSFGG